MSQQVTFVTVGKLAGKTINLGPDGGKFRFVNGEMKVPEEDAGLIARALQFYSAFPKGDAEKYHLAACDKLGIDPKTLHPLPKGTSESKQAEPVAVIEEPVEEEEELELPEEEPSDRFVKLREVLENLDPNDEDHWTGSGKPSLPVVKKEFGDVSRSEVDAVWKEIIDDA